MDECDPQCKCKADVSRRELLKAGVTLAGAAAGAPVLGAQPGYIPPTARKPPPSEWFAELLKPGETIRYTGEHLKEIIFPLGGIGTGTVWLHGTGRLVNWQIFNNIQKDTIVDDSFFAIRIQQEDADPIVRVLQQKSIGPFAGISDITFTGRYPIATLTFRDSTLPVDIELEAFNPLVPLDEKSSGIPCALFTIRAINKTDKPVRVAFLSSLQNAIGHAGKGASLGVEMGTYGGNINKLVSEDRIKAIAMLAEPGRQAEITPPIDLLMDHHNLPILNEDLPVRGLRLASVGAEKKNASVKSVYWLANGNLRQLGGSVLSQIAQDVREYGAFLLLSGVANPLLHPVQATVGPDVRRRETIFATCDLKTLGKWKVRDRAAKDQPKRGTLLNQKPVTGYLGSGLVNTLNPDDEATGTLTSPVFSITERYISFLIGGAKLPNVCCVNLIIGGKVVRTATSRENTEHLQRDEWEVTDLIGKQATIEIVDNGRHQGHHIYIDDIRFSNLPIDAVTVEDAQGWNDLLENITEANPMNAVGVGEGKVIRVPLELGSPKPDVDPIKQRDEVLHLVAQLAEAKYRPWAGQPKDAPSFGTMCLATSSADASARVAWTDRAELFNDFKDDGQLDGQTGDSGEPVHSAGPSDAGRTINAALCVQAEAGPNAQAEATFVLTWHFPNYYYELQNQYRVTHNTCALVGNMYTNWFHNALSTAHHVLADYAYLRNQTFAYCDAMFDTTLPQYLVDCAAANASIARSPTCFWIKDGTFYGFEGCRYEGQGCCPMNCSHVWNYAQTIAKLWPALERNMRMTELKYHQKENGHLYFRVSVPRDNPRKRTSLAPAADGQCGAVLKAYREHLQSTDRRFLDQYWPMIAKAMDFAIEQWDPDHDGVMETPQHNTYDRAIQGHNSFVSSMYLAALRAAEEMARLRRDDAAASRYRDLFEKGSKKIADTLFDGEYYVQIADNLKRGYGKGCWSDQVVGQWWARIVDLGDILPSDQVESALKSVFRYNWLWTQEGFGGTQRYLRFADGTDKGLLCGSWPKGGRPADPIHYRDEVWTGIEYQVAAHKIYEGQIAEGLAIVRGARERYDGRKKSPWNEIECGDYYVRAMSSWSLLLAAQGYRHNGPDRVIGFDPRLNPEQHRSFFSTAEGWGRFEQIRAGHVQTNNLAFIGGRCDLSELRLGLPEGTQTVGGIVQLAGKEIFADVTYDDGTAVVKLNSPITAKAGDILTVTLNWK